MQLHPPRTRTPHGGARNSKADPVPRVTRSATRWDALSSTAAVLKLTRKAAAFCEQPRNSPRSGRETVSRELTVQGRWVDAEDFSGSGCVATLVFEHPHDVCALDRIQGRVCLHCLTHQRIRPRLDNALG